VLLAGLVRALVATVAAVAAAGRPAPAVPEHLLRAAHWNAAHAGLGGTLTDLHRRAVRPAWDLVGELFDAIEPALHEHGDRELVAAGLSRLHDEGNGATRLRRAATGPAGIPGALHDRADLTAAG
jgi:carboxylate-amine ligase